MTSPDAYTSSAQAIEGDRDGGAGQQGRAGDPDAEQRDLALLRRAQSAAERADGVAAGTVMALARRLRPDEVADVGRALKELEQAVGKRGLKATLTQAA